MNRAPLGRTWREGEGRREGGREGGGGGRREKEIVGERERRKGERRREGGMREGGGREGEGEGSNLLSPEKQTPLYTHQLFQLLNGFILIRLHHIHGVLYIL